MLQRLDFTQYCGFCFAKEINRPTCKLRPKLWSYCVNKYGRLCDLNVDYASQKRNGLRVRFTARKKIYGTGHIIQVIFQ